MLPCTHAGSAIHVKLKRDDRVKKLIKKTHSSSVPLSMATQMDGATKPRRK